MTGPGAPCWHCGKPIPEFKLGSSRRTPSHAKGCCTLHAEYAAKGRKSRSERLEAIADEQDREARAWELLADPGRPATMFRPSLIPWEDLEDTEVGQVFEQESAGRCWQGRKRRPAEWRTSPVAA